MPCLRCVPGTWLGRGEVPPHQSGRAQNQRPSGGTHSVPGAQSRRPGAGAPHAAVSSFNSVCLSKPLIPARLSPGRRQPLRSRSCSFSPLHRGPARSAGAPGVDPSTQDGCGQVPHRGAAGRHDHLTSVSPDGEDPSASRVVSYTSRTSAQIHSGVRVSSVIPTTILFRLTGARAPKRRADVPGVTHRAAASAGEPLTSGSAEHRSPGRHLEFIDQVAAGVYGPDLPLFVSGGDPWGPGADWHI
ncbi:hypothetical protein NDU88_001836 [Pleurodeles waltl]|uniref:Uncharacterized protein n=1 Tax=Pleurodeles waltl TaxID=8319 RepID=A0AAV7MMU7_PLEWA|nr:hypothetical protein NDU88_001836 [Pleurodeles waltl]